MNLKIRGAAACLVALAASACSATQSVNVPHCGPAIEQKDVVVGDLRSFKNRKDEIPAYLQAHFGEYTIRSEKPVFVEKDGDRVNVFTSTGLATMRASKAGCNLVLVMDEAGQPATYIGSQFRFWAVHFGTFEPSASGLQKPAGPES